tara:strand:+ start:255 stop:452 length:198 start_codon:yes stop_codon:yes gene_type:complete
MKNYLNLVGFLILFISGIRPLFDSGEIIDYKMTGISLPKYWYILLNIFLSILLLINYIDNKRKKE